MGREIGTTLQLWPNNNVIHMACSWPPATQPLQNLSQREVMPVQGVPDKSRRHIREEGAGPMQIGSL